MAASSNSNKRPRQRDALGGNVLVFTYVKRRRLGRTDLELTELGFGGAPIGGLYRAVDAEAAHAVLEAAWNAGIRYFDTAPLYGYGLSQQYMGEFLRHKPRDEFVISTKVGRTLRPRGDGPDRSGSLAAFVGALPNEAVFDFSADAVKRSIADSLTRLGLTRIDILYIHDPDDHLEQAVLETYAVLDALRAEGIVRAIGAGMNDAALLAELIRRCDLDAVMLAGRYSVLDRTADAELLPLCTERGVAVVAAGVFNSGISSTAIPQADATFDYVPAPPDTLARAQRMAEICERHGVTLPSAALRFPLENPTVACAVVGMRSAAEVEANAARLGQALPPQLWPELAREALHPHSYHW